MYNRLEYKYSKSFKTSLLMYNNFNLRKTSEIVSAYVSQNAVTADGLIKIISDIYSELLRIESTKIGFRNQIIAPTERDIKLSAHEDHLISFIDGKSYKMLKRHLRSHGLSPQQYRKRYGLPSNYPMVAPSYAALRSDIAKRIQSGERTV